MLKQLSSMESQTKDSFTKIWFDCEKQNKHSELKILQRQHTHKICRLAGKHESNWPGENKDTST